MIRRGIMISDTEKARLVVGYKQTIKALSKNSVEKVILAEDCEDRLFSQIKSLAETNGITLSYTDTMHSLGKMCGIDLGASCACILKN